MKRFLKIFSISLLAIILLGIALAVFIRVKYPPERVKQILLGTMAQRYGVTATCERFDFNLFSGFVLKKVRLVEVKNQHLTIPAEFRSPLSIEKINFSYRWHSLLARKLEIDEVTISQPSLRYWQAPDSSTNLEAWLAAFTDSAAGAPAELPFSIHLKSLHLEYLNLFATLISAADTQHIAVDRCNAEITQLEVDRHSRYRTQFKIFATPGRVDYQANPVAAAKPVRFTGLLPLQVSGILNDDSLTTRFEFSWHEAQWTLADQKIALPVFNANGEMQYDFVSMELHVPALQLKLAEALDFAGGFSMRSQPDTALEVRVQRGRFDLDRITDFLQAHRHLDIFAAWHDWHASGHLEITDSYLRRDRSGWQYRAALNGEHISFADSASNFKIADATVQLQGKTSSEKPKGNPSDLKELLIDLSCQLDFASCDLPLDAQTVLATGPAQLRANFLLTPAYSPYRGDVDLRWQNFSGGNVHARANFAAKEVKSPLGTHLKTFLHIEADSLNLASLTANNMAGRLLHADLTIEGERLDALRLTGSLRNAALTYFTEESFGEIPPYHIRLSAQLKTDAAFSRLSFSEGKLQSEIAGAAFRGFYDLGKGLLHFELPEARVSLTEIIPLLPQEIIADTTFPYIAGSAQAQGWFESSTSPAGALKYEGKFFVQSHDGVYADTLSGVFAEKLQIESEWKLAVDSTLGEFRATCPALRLDYLHMPLPQPHATGKIVVYEDRFLVKEGKLEIPKWSIAGNYEVFGKFLPAGMQVRTTVEGGMNAPQELALSPTLSVQGDLNTRFVLEQYLPDDLTAPQPARIEGSVDITHFNFKQDTVLAIRDLNLHATFAQDFDLLDLTLPPASSQNSLALANAGEALLLDEVLGVQKGNDSSPSRLTLAELQFGNYQFQDLAADLALGNGRLEVTQFRMNLFDGNLIGNVLIGLGDGNPDNITYSISAQTSSLDVSRLRRLGAHVEKGSKLSADFFLHGSGASPQKIDDNLGQLLGALNISKIEPKAASNLLQALDPRGTDVGVQRMRLLLKTGWNVKTMKFEIKNGFVYASLSLIKTKPWTALFNLPAKLDFARFPLRYFMQTAE